MTTADTTTINRADLRQLAADLDEAAELGMLSMQSRIEGLAQRVRAMARADLPRPDAGDVTTIEGFRELCEKAGASLVYSWDEVDGRHEVSATHSSGVDCEYGGPDLQAVIDAASADVRGWEVDRG